MSHSIDIYIGVRVREARVERKFSQVRLGGYLGVSFQQIQKYESGRNRVSSSSLLQIATALNKPIVYFFEGLETRRNVSPDAWTIRAASIMHKIYLLSDEQERSQVLDEIDLCIALRQDTLIAS